MIKLNEQFQTKSTTIMKNLKELKLVINQPRK